MLFSISFAAATADITLISAKLANPAAAAAYQLFVGSDSPEMAVNIFSQPKKLPVESNRPISITHSIAY